MIRALFAFILAVTFAGFPIGASAQNRATPDEARAMALRAAELLRQAGPEVAFPQFNSPNGPFHDRDLYVFVYDNNGVAVSRGSNPALIGRNLIDFRDPDGRTYVRDFIAVQTEGWVEYLWQNPQTQAVEHKRSYIVRVGPHLVGVGAYSP